MRKRALASGRPPACARAGLTLVEVVVALLVSTVAMSCLVSGYVYSTTATERSGLTLAANATAVQGVEQTRAAKWDTIASPVVDELVTSNFPTRVITLDVPRKGTNFLYATNFTSVSVISTNPQLKMVRVDCVWAFMGRTLTNTLVTYRRPD